MKTPQISQTCIVLSGVVAIFKSSSCCFLACSAWFANAMDSSTLPELAASSDFSSASFSCFCIWLSNKCLPYMVTRWHRSTNAETTWLASRLGYVCLWYFCFGANRGKFKIGIHGPMWGHRFVSWWQSIPYTSSLQLSYILAWRSNPNSHWPISTCIFIAIASRQLP